MEFVHVHHFTIHERPVRCNAWDRDTSARSISRAHPAIACTGDANTQQCTSIISEKFLKIRPGDAHLSHTSSSIAHHIRAFVILEEIF